MFHLDFEAAQLFYNTIKIVVDITSNNASINHLLKIKIKLLLYTII